MKIKAVFFDLGNTLVTADDFRKNEASRLDQELLRSAGYDVSLEEVEQARKKADEYIQTEYRGNAKIHKRGFYLFVICKFLGLDMDRKMIDELHKKFREKYFKSIRLIPNVKDILSFLKGKGYKLAIISNGSVEGVNKIVDDLKLREYFDLVVASEELGKQKCTTVPLKVALDKLGLKPEEVLMIGDRTDEDILGAKKLGMIAVKHDYGLWKDVNYSGEDVKPDFVINDLLELKDILDEINEGN